MVTEPAAPPTVPEPVSSQRAHEPFVPTSVITETVSAVPRSKTVPSATFVK